MTQFVASRPVSSFTYDTEQDLLDNMDHLDLDPTDRIILMTQLAANRRSLVFCNSCGREGHATKKSAACEHYQEAGPSTSTKSANRDEQANIEKDKKEGRRKRKLETANPDATPRSHMRPTKKQYYDDVLPNREEYTRKLSFDLAVRPDHMLTLQQNVTDASQQLRQLILRVGLFVNHFILTYPQQLVRTVMNGNGLYKVYMLLRGDQNVGGFAGQLPPELLGHFGSLQAALAAEPGSPSLLFAPPPGSIDANTIKCALDHMATGYNESTNEHFEAKFKSYIRFLALMLCGNWIVTKLVDESYIHFAMKTEQYHPAIDWTAVLDHAEWPEDMPHTITAYTDLGNALVTQLFVFKPQYVGIITAGYLKQHPHHSIQLLLEATTSMEQYDNHPFLDHPLPKPFAVLPQPSWGLRHVDLVPENIHCYSPVHSRARPTARQGTGDSDLSVPSAFLSLKTYFDLFRMEHFDIHRHEDLLDPLMHDPLMMVSTNGVEVNFTFSRISGLPMKEARLEDLAPMDHDVRNRFNFSTIDPGRRTTVTAIGPIPMPDTDPGSLIPRRQGKKPANVDDQHSRRLCTCVPSDADESDDGARVLDTSPLPLRRVTAKELHAQSGHTSRMKALAYRKNHTWVNMPGSSDAVTFQTFESTIGTAKTASPDVYFARISKILANLPAICEFYNRQSLVDRFNGYRGKQRATAFGANVLMTGGKKYNKSKRQTWRTKRNRRNRRNKAYKKKLMNHIHVLASMAAQRSLARSQLQAPLVPIAVESLNALERDLIHTLDSRPPPLPMKDSTRILHGVVKNDGVTKVPAIAFGSGMKQNVNRKGFKGHITGASEMIRRLLLEHMARGKCLVFSMDEFRTSRHQRVENFRIGGQGIFALKSCSTCRTVFERDRLAASAMAIILTTWEASQTRSLPWQRPGRPLQA
ncbi:hypothetical protein DM01DRAFT_1386592 [Hesseltinella vesiculosa]|uniref:Uncharacterized protein n=1 Tax=Hesseltinella vesiculosa TaxID=101127 RepID=A0A1X2G4Y5_9FUNG|nr:hypothetical protein DM01DRAFT_1386592 [Hesseltinella vesiculosa]